jgi:hypothetical protein
MNNSLIADFGRCPCSGYYETRWVEVPMIVEGEVIVLTDVPQGACSLCGSRVYKPLMLERIEAVLKAEPLDRQLNQPLW